MVALKFFFKKSWYHPTTTAYLNILLSWNTYLEPSFFFPGLRCLSAISIDHFLSPSLTVLQILSHLQPECQHIRFFTVMFTSADKIVLPRYLQPEQCNSYQCVSWLLFILDVSYRAKFSLAMLCDNNVSRACQWTVQKSHVRLLYFFCLPHILVLEN